MMPAERVSGAVPVRSNSRPQLPYRGNKLLARHRFEVFVHDFVL
jgi:hypothetical protein